MHLHGSAAGDKHTILKKELTPSNFPWTHLLCTSLINPFTYEHFLVPLVMSFILTAVHNFDIVTGTAGWPLSNHNQEWFSQTGQRIRHTKKHVQLKTGFVDFTILCKDLLFLQGKVVYKSWKLAKFPSFYARFHQLLSFLQEPWYDQEMMFIV